MGSYFNSLEIGSPERDEVELAIFGPGYGESIVIHIPKIGWGIVDCCEFGKFSSKIVPPLEYLIYQNVNNIAFLILTHPHADHFNGMEKIISNYIGKIDRICRYTGESVRELTAYLTHRGIKGNPGAKKFSIILEAFNKAVSNGAERRYLGANTQIIPAQKRTVNGKPIKIEVLSLSPLAEDEEVYNNLLKDALVEPGKELRQIPDRQHNLIASAIRIAVGKVVVILGSDVEKGESQNSGWHGIMNSIDSSNMCIKMLKVPHHGSPNAYCKNAWEEHCKLGKIISIITPYSRGVGPRPSEKDIKRISHYSEYIGITSQLKFLRPVDVYDRAVARRLPKKWKIIMEQENAV